MIHIGRAGQKLGVFSEEEVRAGLVTGRFSASDLGWREGMANWEPLSNFEELNQPLPPPEPPPIPALDEPPALERGAGLPWDDRATKGWMIAFAETARFILTNPAAAFARMKPEGDVKNPLLFNMIGGWIGLVASTVYTLIVAKTQPPLANPPSLQRTFLPTPEMAQVQVLAALILGPIIVTLSTIISAGIAHLLLMLTGGANKSYYTTLRVFCFAYGATQLLHMMPVCGGPLSLVWLLVCCAIGLTAAHETTTARATGAMVLFLVLFSLCCVGAAVTVLITAFGTNPDQWRALMKQ
jgi:hypothetical protein